MAKLNLKKELTTKEVEIDGFDGTVTIYPIGGFGLMKLQKMFKEMKNDEEELKKDSTNFSESFIEKQEALAKFALQWGCKATDEDIKFLIENDILACIQLTEKVIEFSAEYNENLLKKKDEIKKKLNK